MGREDLDIAPGEADQVRLEGCRCIAEGLAALGRGKEREIQDLLAHLRPPAMDKVRQIGDPDGVDLFAREEDV